jgi:hypothetical protein
MPLTRSVSAALLGLLATAAIGCTSTAQDTSGDFKGTEKDVADAIEDLQTAAQDDKPARVCRDLLSARLTRQLGDRCERTIATAFDDSDTFDLSVKSIRVTADRARARVTTGRDADQEELLVLVRDRGKWRIDEFGGVVGR